MHLFAVPASACAKALRWSKAGTRVFQMATNGMDARFRRYGDLLRLHQNRLE